MASHKTIINLLDPHATQRTDHHPIADDYRSPEQLRRQLAVPGTDIRVSLLRVQIVGTVEECDRAVERLARHVCRKRA